MLSNIEQAIANVLAAKHIPNYENVLGEYMTLTGYVASMDRKEPNYFHNAIDKYTDSGEKADSLFAHHVSQIRKQEFERTLGLMQGLFGSDSVPCPCCGVFLPGEEIKRIMGFTEEIVTESKKDKPRRVVKKKLRSKRVTGKAIAFDPHGPSTSASSM